MQDLRRALAMGAGVVLTAVAMALLASPVLRSGPSGQLEPSLVEGQVRMAEPPTPPSGEAPGSRLAPETVAVAAPPAAAPAGSGLGADAGGAVPAAPPLQAALARGGGGAPALVATAASAPDGQPSHWFTATTRPLAAEPPRSAGKHSGGRGKADARKRPDGRKTKRNPKPAPQAPASPVAAAPARAVATQPAPPARPRPAAPARPQPKPRKPRPAAADPAPVDPAPLARGRHGHVPPGQLRKALRGH